jgi:outer membrane protein assembly factor BamA
LLCLFSSVFSREITLLSDEPHDLVSRRLKDFIGQSDISVPEYLLSIADTRFAVADVAPFIRSYRTIESCIEALCTILSLKTVASIAVMCEEPEVESNVLYLTIERVPLISRVAITSDHVEKSLLRSVYPLVIGDPYDAVRHREGLTHIKELLDDLGYRSAVITERVEIDRSGKSVTIFFECHEGMRTRLASIPVVVVDQQGDAEAFGRALGRYLIDIFCGAPIARETLASLKEQVKRFLVQNGYYEATVEYHETVYRRDNEATLSLSIRRGQRRLIEYIGCRGISRDSLGRLISRFGKTVPYVPASLICEEIAEYYRSEGYRSVAVSFEEVPDELHIIVSEGAQTIIHDAYCVGGVPDLFSQTKKILTQYPWPYSDSCRAQKRSLILELYQAQGYWDVQLSEESITEDGSLCCMVNPGTQRCCAGIDTTAIPQPFLQYLSPEKIRVGAPAHKKLHEQIEYDFIKELKAAGYLAARPRVVPREGADGVVYEIMFEKIPQRMLVEDLILDSASAIPSERLRTLASGIVGAPATKQSVERVVDMLRQTGAFSAVSCALRESESSPLMRAYLSVVDDAPHEVRARGGMQLVGQNFEFRRIVYKVGGSWLWKNPTARADSARLDIDYVRYRREAQLWYTLPWDSSYPIKTDLKIYTIRYDQPFVIGSPHILYEAFQNGMLASVSTRAESFWGCMTGGFEFVSIGSITDLRARELVFDPSLVNRQIPYAFCEPSVLWEQLNNKIDPTAGYRLLASCKALIPFDLSRALCFKTIIESALYRPFGSCSCAIRVRMGHIFNEDFERVMPIERFYLGGSYSLRGYEPDLAPPVNQLICEGYRYRVPIGGRSMVLINAEWRFPIMPICNGVFFSDCGALEPDYCAALMPKKLLGDTGFGVRVKTPVGPLRFDIAWKWYRCENECPYMWYITLGNAF